jgi:hypothetical protein
VVFIVRLQLIAGKFIPDQVPVPDNTSVVVPVRLWFTLTLPVIVKLPVIDS